MLVSVCEVIKLDFKMTILTSKDYKVRHSSCPVSIRYRHVLILAAVSGIFFIVTINRYPDTVLRRNELHAPVLYNPSLYTNQENYTIETQGCKIPSMQAINKIVEKFVQPPTKLKPCPNTNNSLLEQNGTHIWIVKDTRILRHYKVAKSKYIRCCYSSFYRPDTIDDITNMNLDERIKYNECIYFHDIIAVNDEFVRVKCFFKERILYDQFLVFALYKDNAEEHNNNSKAEKPAYNVLILGIDNVSRLNFHRTMPKTVEFMKSRGAIELMGYNKVGDNSYPNIVPLLMGYADTEIKEICHPIKKTTYDDCPFLWHWYKEAGYYTAFGEDSGKLGTFNYLRKGFRRSPTDYYLHPFMSEAEKYAGKHKDFNVVLCMNEYYLYQMLLDYIQSLTETLWDLKLFGFFWETTMSHDDLNYPMAMDNSYVRFFQELEKSDYLNNTIIFLISDHGMRWGGIRKTKQGYLEERLPLVNVLLPHSFRENYSEAYNNLKYNSRHLTTPYDLHKTLRDLIDLENIKDKNIILRSLNMNANDRGISMFLKIPQNRTCKSAGIADHWCTCHQHVEVSNTTNAVVTASTHLIDHLNFLLSDHPKCMTLELEEIQRSVEIVADVVENFKADWKEYSVVVKAKPSGAVFEATLRDDGSNWSVIGSVSRLNLYGDQSSCVQDNVLKLYCYCIKE